RAALDRGVVVGQVGDLRVDHLLRPLRGGPAVEVDHRGVVIEHAGQDRDVRADRLDVELSAGCTHRRGSSFARTRSGPRRMRSGPVAPAPPVWDPARQGGRDMSPWAQPAARPLQEVVMETLVLAALFVSIVTFVVITIGRLVMRRREQRERWEQEGRPEPVPRTPEEKERDRRTAITWGCLALALPVVLVLLSTVTR